MLVGLDKVMTYELQSVEHKEGVKEILDCWFGILAFISFLNRWGNFWYSSRRALWSVVRHVAIFKRGYILRR